MVAPKKRKLDSIQDEDNGKRLKMAHEPHNVAETPSAVSPEAQVIPTRSLAIVSEPVAQSDGVEYSEAKGKEEEKEMTSAAMCHPKPRRRIKKLTAPRPFPTVPTSVSATGPRSSHREGKNMICLTRKTSLGNYMRRCKDVILVDGYKTLHLSAMGAAIPLLTQLICALPPILPFSQDEIHTEITTGTVEVQDEVIPEDDDEDLTYQTRGKSSLRVVFKIGDGEFEGDRTALRKYSAGKSVGRSHEKGNSSKKDQKGKGKAKESSAIVLEEPEQEHMDML